MLLCVSGVVHASEAERLLRAGQVLDAIPVAEREALSNPADIEAWERWIDLYQSVGLLPRLLPTVQTRVNRNPDDPTAHVLLGRALQDPAASRRAYETALRLDPTHARAWVGIGAIERATGELKASAEAYQRALQADRSLAEAWTGLLTVYGALGDEPGVRQLAAAATEVVPDQPDPWLARAATTPSEAGAILRRAVEAVGWDARVVAALAEQLLREGDVEGAWQAAGRALRLDPRHRGARFARLVTAEIRAGHLSVSAALTLADARGRPGTEALPVLSSLAVEHPESAMVLIGRAMARPPGDLSARRADLERALTLDPDHPEARATLGLLLAADQPATAADLLAPVAAARPDDPDLAAALARTRIAAGRAAAALEDVMAAAERHPYHVPLALEHIRARNETGDAMGALAAARALADRVPSPRTRLVWAAAAQDAGRLGEAMRVYRRLAEQTGDARFSRLADQLADQGAGDADP